MRKLYVVGFDGATWRFIEPLVQRGELPNFGRLMRQGSHGVLTSTIPSHSAAAWVTFMTGRNCGKHGVYMFQDYDALSYDYVGRTANSRYFSGQTIFDIVGEMGGTVGVIRIPMTYPAWPVKGFMVSGFPTPGDTADSFYPTELQRKVGRAGESESSDFRLLSTDEQIASLDGQMERMSALVRSLMEHPVDLFAVVHRVPDPVHHFFMGFVDQRTPVYDTEQAQRYGDAVNHFYRKMDEALGETLDRLGPEDTIFVISDHGGNITPPRMVNLNAWLAQSGLLTPLVRTRSAKERLYALNRRLLPGRVRALLRRRAPKSVRGDLKQLWKGLQQVDFDRTQAYHFPMKNPPLAGIVINLRGRQPRGVVPPDQYDTIRERIIRDLHQLRDPRTSEPVVRTVLKREELYHGPYTDRAPDLVVWYHDLYKEGPLAQGPIVDDVPYDELQQVPGAHDENGIFLAMGPGIASGNRIEGARLIDVPATILHAMELAVPSDLDGRVLTEIYADRQEVKTVDLVLSQSSAESYLSEDEEQQIKEKLKGWGYL